MVSQMTHDESYASAWESPRKSLSGKRFWNGLPVNRLTSRSYREAQQEHCVLQNGVNVIPQVGLKRLKWLLISPRPLSF